MVKPGPKKGTPKSQAHKDAISAAMRGKKKTVKHRAAIAASVTAAARDEREMVKARRRLDVEREFVAAIIRH
jgi:hypothetical protein